MAAGSLTWRSHRCAAGLRARWLGALRRELAGPVGGQQFIDLVRRVRCYTHEHVGEVADHIDVGQAAALDE